MNSAVINYDVFKQNLHILDLAFDYLSVDPAEKTKILDLLEQKSKENPDIRITEIFKQENLVSNEDIDCLAIFDEHLRTICQDSQFGKLAVANHLASKYDVDKALEQQREYFTKYRINMKLGDILVENNIISHANRISILLTQNRIKDENLFEALNDIGATPLEKEAVNKRFGALAIKQGLVTIDQVNAALEIQKNEQKTKEKPRFLGQILQETAGLSDEDIMTILQEQKQFEKRKLDLEKALYSIKSEIKISQKLNKIFEYQISKDGVEAYVKKLTDNNQDIPTYEFLIWLKRAGIRFGIVKNSIIDDLIQNKNKNTPVLIAKGYPVEPCVNERVEFYFENEFSPPPQASGDDTPKENNKGPDETIKKQTEEKPAESQEASAKKTDSENEDLNQNSDTQPLDDSKTQEDKEAKKEQASPEKEDEESFKDTAAMVKRGTILARIIPGKEGKPGKDVLGYMIKPDKPATCILNAERGVVRKGDIFIALTDGRPILKNGNILMVEPMVEEVKIQKISGSINEDTKESYASQTVELTGSLTPEGILRCHGLICQADLVGHFVCSGDIDVKGNIGTNQKQKGSDTIQETDITCHGSVKVSKSVINANIQTAGEFLGANARISGSRIMAFKGMVIKDAVSDENNTPCVLQFGLRPGDKNPAVDHTIEMKKAELPILRKEKEIKELTEEYEKDKALEEAHQDEQNIIKNILEIIDAPELYQHEGLENKLKYLYSLPDFSSVKSFYLRFPETDEAQAFRNKILMSTAKMSLDKLVEDLRKKIDPEPEKQNEDEEIIPKLEQIKTQYRARLAAFDQEIKDKSGEIEKIEKEIKELYELKEKFNAIHLKTLHQSTATIKIKNECQKGTVIKGKIAQLVLERSLYKVEFKEILDQKTKQVSIIIENY